MTELKIWLFQKILEASFMRGIKALEDPRRIYIADALAEATGTGAKGANSANNVKYTRIIATALAENMNKAACDNPLVEAVERL